MSVGRLAFTTVFYLDPTFCVRLSKSWCCLWGLHLNLVIDRFKCHSAHVFRDYNLATRRRSESAYIRQVNFVRNNGP